MFLKGKRVEKGMEINKEFVEDFVQLTLTIAGCAGFLWGVNYGPKYEINGNKVKDKILSVPGRTLIEYKEGDRIKYWGSKEGKLDAIAINGRVYDSNNTTIYLKGQERYHYLLKEIEKIKDAKKGLIVQNQLEKKLKKDKKRRDKINRDLEVLKK